MQLRRCAHLVVALDDEPRFDFNDLLAGGDGLARQARWLAQAPHLPEAVPVTLAQLAVLEAVGAEAWAPRAELEERFGAPVIADLLDGGLLLSSADAVSPVAAADQSARELAWWPPALLAQAQGAWRGVDIEAREAQGLRPSARELVESFGAAPTPAPRKRTAAERVALAPARQAAFDELLQARRTCRNFDPAATLDAERFATMMRRTWGALGTHELAPGAVVVKKTSPAGGGMHAVEAYALVQRVEGLSPGLYHYLPMEHALEPLQAMAAEEAAGWAHRFVAGQAWFRDAPVLVVMVARFDRLFWKYRRHAKAWRVVHLDVGHLSQTMYLSATELGLGAFVTAAINDGEIGELLGLPPLREGVIALVGFGPRAATMTHRELVDLDPVPAGARQPPGAP